MDIQQGFQFLALGGDETQKFLGTLENIQEIDAALSAITTVVLWVFVAGGILEVQPHVVTVLSDTAIRGKDLDDERANAARKAAEEALRNAKSEIDVARATSELAILAAELAALRKYRERPKH